MRTFILQILSFQMVLQGINLHEFQKKTALRVTVAKYSRQPNFEKIITLIEDNILDLISSFRLYFEYFTAALNLGR